MNTNALKSFAKAARIQLVDAVAKQILYWGFSQKGEVENEPTATQGGYVHRGEPYNDTTVIPKWQRLKEKITSNKEAFKDVAEEAAYTWFNRLVAIKVLEENGFIEPFLQFADGTQSPIALQNAKAGNHTVTHSTLKANLKKALLENDEETAFSILLINFCNTHPLLNQVFGRVNDYTELLIPQNLLSIDGFLLALNTEIAEEDFKEVELIGWLYQFYISDKKDEVFKGFKANKKARPEDIPAATQIFTPKWIVNYMVENTVGKIYLDFEEDSDLKDQMKYLVENETEGKGALIDDIEQLTLIDPACGSGHILVVGFEWLYKMYREQGYTAKNAIESILKNNLYGLDIDDRAMQLARFAVLLKAAQQLQQVDISQAMELMNNPLDVIPHIYAFPESIGFTSEEVALFTQNQHVQEVYKAFEALREGKNIGSALKISLSDTAREVLIAQYYAWSNKDKQGTLDIEEIGVWYKLKSYTEVALVLSKKYAAVVANPPYMGQKSMNAQLKDYVNAQYPMTKADLFAVFMEVCLALNRSNGLMGMINQHSWMFLSSFENYRTHLLLNQTIQSMLHLGPRTFEELSGEVVQSTAFVLENRTPQNAKGSYYRLVDYKSNNEKEEQFLKGTNFYPNIPQTNFDKIPGSPIAYWVSKNIIKIFNKT
ncbi:BREX-1 system adenine-specific DNA-methyltransferase PglX [Xiashengella succiniciproducens]|uniref:site-specific DNA-methyltransferase (adenine-specific) n=1 Tax=Xiashengella succiniciproducens TaxID=2949635 RepID=A0A9J6ZSW5_9BACT|nr:BREX-1 system adenine-specific DNA-methyltransferase PglX [Alkaliflexus sp. Ai-910]URW80673.1 BREX-1 system adenine-specific DNA-methyltransferase PglX [Alkaliflexus sp. Ai-910]